MRFYENPQNLYRHGGIAANDFVPASIVGSNNPTDRGKRRLELCHGAFRRER